MGTTNYPSSEVPPYPCLGTLALNNRRNGQTVRSGYESSSLGSPALSLVELSTYSLSPLRDVSASPEEALVAQ